MFVLVVLRFWDHMKTFGSGYLFGYCLYSLVVWHLRFFWIAICVGHGVLVFWRLCLLFRFDVLGCKYYRCSMLG